MHTRGWVLALLVISLSLIITACGGAQAEEPAPTATTAALATRAPVATAIPASVIPDDAPAPTSAPSVVQADGEGTMRFRLDPQASEARYLVREQLARLSFPSDAAGTTSAISGQIVVRADGTVVREESKIVVDLTTLTSDENRRDNYIKNNTLQTNQHPTAEFVPTEMHGLPLPLPESGQGTFQLVGDLTVRGVTRSVTWGVTAQYDGQEMIGKATTSVTFGDFGMSAPQVFVVLSVEDNIRLELDFRLVRE
jgi:polyisoprenoid-binding protein YceI